jgi:hypothetical protein
VEREYADFEQSRPASGLPAGHQGRGPVRQFSDLQLQLGRSADRHHGQRRPCIERSVQQRGECAERDIAAIGRCATNLDVCLHDIHQSALRRKLDDAAVRDAARWQSMEVQPWEFRSATLSGRPHHRRLMQFGQRPERSRRDLREYRSSIGSDRNLHGQEHAAWPVVCTATLREYRRGSHGRLFGDVRIYPQGMVRLHDYPARGIGRRCAHADLAVSILRAQCELGYLHRIVPDHSLDGRDPSGRQHGAAHLQQQVRRHRKPLAGNRLLRGGGGFVHPDEIGQECAVRGSDPGPEHTALACFGGWVVVSLAQPGPAHGVFAAAGKADRPGWRYLHLVVGGLRPMRPGHQNQALQLDRRPGS